MYSVLAIAALSMGVTSGKTSPAPVWENDYRAAMARVNEAGKPMVLIIASGKGAMESVVNEGSFDASVTKLLAAKFVCVYIDTNTTSGKALAEALQIKTGVVISDKTGLTQAFSSAVAMPRAMLETALVKYAEADPKTVKKTETVVDPKMAPAPMAIAPAGQMMMGRADCGQQGYSGGYGNGYGRNKGGCCFFGGCGKGGHQGNSCGQPVAHQGGGCCNKGYGMNNGSGCGMNSGYGGGCGKSYGGGWGGGCGKGYGGGCK